MAKVGITDTILRDAHQSLIATRMTTEEMLPALEQLGITDLLSPETADLSALTSLDAYLSGARQLARVTADEEGVEAAAVTILTMEATSAMPDPEPMVMDLDRPFLFVIRCGGVPLFVGTVNQIAP